MAQAGLFSRMPRVVPYAEYYRSGLGAGLGDLSDSGAFPAPPADWLVRTPGVLSHPQKMKMERRIKVANIFIPIFYEMLLAGGLIHRPD